ncbi:MAG: NifB/NifX family molybdenum-iron cluster-binding protein [Candidatus Bipolaricaulota bacterium]|nr:NifB/NifX family molybdenum-iron cluster-binding protein [Candidatus Bipolaricaulota bacterium]
MSNEQRRRIQLAIACEGQQVPRRHFGDCPEFLVYELHEDGEYRLIKTQSNTSPEEKRHADPEKLKGVAGLLSGCEVLVSGLQSPNFARIRDTRPIQPVVTKEETLAGTLSALGKAFEELFQLVSARRRGERPAVILTVANANKE